MGKYYYKINKGDTYEPWMGEPYTVPPEFPITIWCDNIKIAHILRHIPNPEKVAKDMCKVLNSHIKSV